jgi:hypothetical protein
MVNALLVNPLTNIIMVAIWAVAGLVGGIIAGTKKGAFVVGLFTWLSCIGVLVFCAFQLFQSGISLGTLPPMPEGGSIVDILSIPLVQDLLGSLLGIIGIGGGGGMPDIATILTPLLTYLLVPVVVVIVVGMIGATIRPKE